MKETRLTLSLIFGLTLVMSTMLSASAAPGEPEQPGLTGSPAGPPMLGAFINVWLETGVDNTEPAIAYNSRHDEYLVVWTNIRAAGATKDIYARRVRGDGTLRSSFTIVHDANYHNYEPDVAYSPAHDEYLVVYTYDNPLTDSDIWARRVSWDGSWMSGELALARDSKNGKQHNPAVTYNPDSDEYLVVWQNSWSGSYDIDARRVRASDGTSPGWVNIVAGAGYRSEPDVAYSPASNFYLIAYRYRPSLGAFGDIYSKVTSWNIGYISPETHICDDSNDQSAVAVSASEDEYLAVWADAPNAPTTKIYARRLLADGTPVGPGGGFWIAGVHNRHDMAPAVTYGTGHGYLIAWQRYAGSGPGWNVHGRYTMPGSDWAMDSEFALDDDVRDQRYPVVACGPHGDSMMAEEDANSAGGDLEIRGRLAWFRHAFVPLVMRDAP
jgi:hypothetical protein